MIERAKNQNQKNPKGFKQTPQKLLDQNLTPENPMPNFRAKKISRTQRQSQNSFVFILITEVSRGNYHKSSDCFEYPKKSVV